MLLRKLSVYEKKPQPFDHETPLINMERDAEKMKKELDLLGAALTIAHPFHLDKTNEKQQPEDLPIFESKNTILANCDVRGFRPEELKVRAVGTNLLEVTAEHHEKNGLSESHNKFVRHFQLPPGISIHDISPNLTPEGSLIVAAPRKENEPREFAPFRSWRR